MAANVNDVNAGKEEIAVWLNIQQASRVLQERLEGRLRVAADLSWAEFEVLFRLQVAGARTLQMHQVASQTINSPSGATRIADRLEKDGLIERDTPRDNRRVVELKLTSRGRSVLAMADEAFRQELHDGFGAHLDDAELTSLRALMRRVLEKNGAWNDERCAPVS